MAEHSELVSEMAILEKLGTQERLKMAKKRRLQQLKKWSQREKEYNNQAKKNKKTDLSGQQDEFDKENRRKRTDNVHFVPSVMLLEAAARNDIDEVRRLLMMGVDPDSTNEDGLTALHQCCIDDSEEMMKLLVDFGANVNAKDSEQWTPLHAAATCGHLHLVKYLIEKGANLLAVNADNNMPYDICEHEVTLDYIEQQMASRGITQEQIDETRAQTETEMLEFLRQQLNNGVDLNTIKFGDSSASALHVASANGYLQVVEFLLENNFNVNINDNDNWQPAHAAVCWQQPDVLEILAQAGADLDARTKNGETLFDICEDLELKEQIEQLKNEMETKQLLQQQQSLNGSSRLKRSHSQNTRSQSVRRTSIREKRDTSRREAREEAKIRHHLDDDLTDAKQQPSSTQISSSSSASSSKQAALSTANVTSVNNITNVSNINQSTFNHSHHQHNNNSLNIPLSTSNYAQDHHQVNSNETRNQQQFDNQNISTNKTNLFKDRQFGGKSSSNEVDSSLKLEINVNQANGQLNSNALNNYPTNCSNMNTLSDLKRFRTDLRHRNNFNNDLKDMKESLINNELYKNKTNHKFNNEQMNDGLVNRFDCQNKNMNNTKPNLMNNSMMSHCTSGNNGTAQQNNYNNNYLTPSPNSTLKKFRGDPSDMIGEMQKRKCCSMM